MGGDGGRGRLCVRVEGGREMWVVFLEPLAVSVSGMCADEAVNPGFVGR